MATTRWSEEQRSAAHQVNDERNSNGNRGARSHQDRRGRTILHDADPRVNLGVQMIRQVLERRIEELGGYHHGAGHQHDRPPGGFQSHQRAAHNYDDEGEQLKPKTALGAKG